MLLAITKFPSCGFGNRLIYYFNLRKEANNQKCDYFSVPWEGYQYFDGNMLGTFPPNEKYTTLDFCLGDKFYSDDKTKTRDIFKLKNIPNVPADTCAIHFRGSDFFTWNPKSILNVEYYYDSIDIIKDKIKNFVLFTDDENLKSYNEIKNFLEKNNINFFVGDNTSNRQNYINDFSYMSECDWIISSPSTFCICAGFIGKKKNIIHSKEWVEYRIESEDKFWIDLYNGGNDNYKLWRTV